MGGLNETKLNELLSHYSDYRKNNPVLKSDNISNFADQINTAIKDGIESEFMKTLLSEMKNELSLNLTLVEDPLDCFIEFIKYTINKYDLNTPSKNPNLHIRIEEILRKKLEITVDLKTKENEENSVVSALKNFIENVMKNVIEKTG